MRRRTFIAALAAAGLSRNAFAALEVPDAIDRLVQAQLPQQRIPGAAIAVVKAGEVVKTGAYGLADLDKALPVTPDTVFRIGSITKPFTATGVMMLVEAGKVGLDLPITSYLDACPAAWQAITVRHLLNQTSGLPDFANEATIDLQVEVGDQQLMASIANRPLKFQPGAAWSYSNSNYLLLAMLIGAVTGKPYGDVLAERIFQPLGMTRTGVPRGHEAFPGQAIGYEVDNGKLLASQPFAAAAMNYGGGGICSTVLDLAKWDAALYTERLLKRETLTQMWTPARLTDGNTYPYGLGWEIGVLNGHNHVFHGGDWIGFSANVDRFVDDRLTFIVLTNVYKAAPARISRAIAGTYLPDTAPVPYHAIPDTEPDVTAHLADILKACIAGNLRAEDFTDQAWAYLKTYLGQLKRDFAPLGPLQSLTLVERTVAGSDKSYRYQARFSHTQMIFHFVLTKDNRISTMTPEAVNE